MQRAQTTSVARAACALGHCYLGPRTGVVSVVWVRLMSYSRKSPFASISAERVQSQALHGDRQAQLEAELAEASAENEQLVDAVYRSMPYDTLAHPTLL